MITDIDKSGLDRAMPSPNRHDQMAHDSVMAKGTNSTNYTTAATNTTDIASAKNGQFTIVQTNSFITTQTYNTTNPGSGNYASDTFTVYQQPHNLSFIPGILAYELSSSNQYSPMPLVKYQTGSTSQALWYNFQIFVDATYVYINLNTLTFGAASFSFNPGFNFRWYLLYQTSN
jgi:hypothetical protein